MARRSVDCQDRAVRDRRWVGDAVQSLNEVKAGEQVVLRVTDALAILVEKP
jgi:hypothetical protein